MSKRGNYENYEHLNVETIKRACKGDGDALSAVISRYQNYGRKCFRTIAITKYNLDMRTVPMDDLMQVVWMRLVKVIVKKYKVSD